MNNEKIQPPTPEQEQLISKAHENICRKKGNYQYSPTSTEIEDEINKMQYVLNVTDILMNYDFEIKKQLLNYSIDHSIHSKMCVDLSDIRNAYIKKLKSTN